MKHRTLLLYAAWFLVVGLLLITPQVHASAPYAKVTQFKGEAVVRSGTVCIPIKQIGQPVNRGDRIQTKKGEVELTFTDGALLKIRPYTNASGDEREEETGFWIFKDKKPMRRPMPA